MAKSVFNILAPAGGLYKRRSYQEDPPFTTPDCDNVRLDDAIDGRERVGSRPGLIDLDGDVAISNGEIRLITSVRWLDGSTPPEWNETLFAVAGTKTYYSINDGDSWSATNGLTALESTVVRGPITAAQLHQKLYIGDVPPVTGDAEIKVFDPSTNTLALIVETVTSPVNEAPLNCAVAVAYRDRLLMTGDRDKPHMWYMSRSGDPTDFDYNATDVLSAVNGQNSTVGELGEAINCAIPHGDDCVIFGCTDSIWTLRSDPNFGGTLDNLSQRVGIVGRNAWCRTSEGWLFFLTQDGVMVMPPGCGDTPRSISRERLPSDLMFIDAMDFSSGGTLVSMAYDIKDRGVHLWVTSMTAGSSTHYWLDIKQVLTQDAGNVASFWPLSCDTSDDAFCVYAYEQLGNTTDSDVIIGCRDKQPRIFSTRFDCEKDSYVDIGPLSTTGRQGSYLNGRLDQINAVLANGSGTITYEIRVGESPEAAFDGPVVRSGTWTKQHSLIRPRIRDPYFVIRLKASGSVLATDKWAFENMTCVTEEAGKMRYQS